MAGLTSQVKKFTVVLSGQMLMAVAGFIFLPLIARASNPAVYGNFSLFLVLFGALINLEVGRVLFTKLLHKEPFKALKPQISAELFWINWINVVFVTSLGVALFWGFLGFEAAIGGGGVLFLYCASSVPFSLECLRGRTHLVLLMRNIAQFSAFGLVLVGYYTFGKNFPFWLPFVLTYSGMFMCYWIWAPFQAPDQFRIKRKADFRVMIKDALQIFWFNSFSIVLVAADRAILRLYVPAAEFGRATAQTDLGIRLNLFVNAVGNFIYPLFVRRSDVDNKGNSNSPILLGLVILHAIVLPMFLAAQFFSDSIVSLFFGTNFLGDLNALPIALAAVFLGASSFVIVPWQRARGDFQTSFYVNGINAFVQLCLIFILIPTLGFKGFLVTLLVARFGGGYLFLQEVYRHTTGGYRMVLLIGTLGMYATIVWSGIGFSGL